MSVIILLGIILLCFFTKNISLEGEIKKLLYIFFIYWGMGIFLSSFGFYGIDIPSNYAQFLLLLHLFGFFSGVYFFTVVNNSNKGSSNSLRIDIVEEVNTILKSRLFWAIFSISFIYVLFLFQTYITSLAFYGRSGAIREDMEAIYGLFYRLYGSELLIQPVKILCFPLFGYAFVKKRIAISILLGLYLVMEATLSGGRFGYGYIVLAVVFMNVVVIKRNIKKYTPYFLVVLLLFFIASSYTKATRMGYTDFTMNNIVENGMNANAEQIVTSYTGPMAAFDYSLNHDYLRKIGDYQYGGLTFSPVIMMLHTMGTFLGVDFEVPIEKVYFLLEYNQIDIGADHWNAFFTSVIYYYLDLGIFGVYIFPFFVGFLFVFLTKKMVLTQSFWMVSIVCIFYIYMIKSEMKLEIISGKLFTILILYYLLGIFNSNKRIIYKH